MPTNSKVFLHGLLNVREKQILTSDIEIQKKIGGNHAFFDDNQSTTFVKSFKIQSNVCANGSNIVALCFHDHETKEMLVFVGSKV